MRGALMWLGLLAWIGGALVLPAPAIASYPGAAGQITYQDSFFSTDPLNNGAATYSLHLREPRAAHAGPRSLLGCAGDDSGFRGPATCPAAGVGFSPDGTGLVFAGFSVASDGTLSPSSCGGGWDCIPGDPPHALFVGSANGAGPVRVPIAALDAEHPALMPDGAHLVFVGRSGPAATPQLYTAGRDGSGLRQITTAGGRDPAPCANGIVLYVHAGHLWRLGPGTHAARPLGNVAGLLPDCAPDSQAVAYLDRGALFTVGIDGRHRRRLSPAGVVRARPAFSPAGGRIAFMATLDCTPGRNCQGWPPSHSECTTTYNHLQVIDLRGRVRRSDVIGHNLCSSDGDLGGDLPGDVAWQPRPEAPPTS